MATAKELFSGLLAVYRNVSSGAIPADKANDVSIKGLGKFSEVRKAIEDLEGASKFCLEFPVYNREYDPEVWIRILFNRSTGGQTAARIDALRWASDLLGTEVEYDLRFVAVLLVPKLRPVFNQKYADVATAARRDIDIAVEFGKLKKHMDVLDQWAGLFNQPEGRGGQTTATPTAKTQIELESETPTVVVVTHAPPQLEISIDDPSPGPAPVVVTAPPAVGAGPAGTLLWAVFSDQQVKDLAAAGVPGASDELVRRLIK